MESAATPISETSQSYLNLLASAESADLRLSDADLQSIQTRLNARAEKAAHADYDTIALVERPGGIQSGNENRKSTTFEADGENALYSADWVGDPPDGLVLQSIDTGKGPFQIAVDADAIEAGEYGIMVRDEDRRFRVVEGKIKAPEPVI